MRKQIRRSCIERMEQRMLLSLSPYENEYRLNIFTTGAQTNPVVAIDGDGDFAVAWDSAGQDGSGTGVYVRFRRWDISSLSDSFEVRANTFTTGDQSNPVIARDPDGDFVVVWQSAGQDGSGAGIYAQRFNFSAEGEVMGMAGNEFRVNQYTTGDQAAPAVAMDVNGNFVVAWHSDGQDGSGLGVYARRFAADGVPLGDEFRVNVATTLNQFFPAVAMDADGDFVVTWQGTAPDLYADIFARRYNKAGVPQGGEFRVNTYTTNDQVEPAVAMSPAGNFVVAWDSFGQDGSMRGVYAQRFNAAGQTQGEEFRVNVTTSLSQSVPSVAMAPGGDFIIGWGGTVSGSGSDAFLRVYGASGVPLSGEIRANTFTSFNQGNPQVAIARNGSVSVVWYGDGQDGSGHGVYTQQYTLATLPRGAEFRSNTTTTASQNEHAIASDDDGDFVVVWQSISQDGSGGGIYGQRYNASGVPQGSEFRVNTFTTNTQRLPAVAMDGDGDFVVAWQSFAQDGSIYGIYAQRFNALGVPQGSEFRVNSFTTGQQVAPAVGMNRFGDFVIAWESTQDGSVGSIYAQRYNLFGTPIGVEFRVNTFTAGSQYRASVAVNDDQSFVIAWGGGLITNEDVFFQRYNALGLPQGLETRANTFTSGTQHLPSIAADVAGNFLIAWTSRGQDGSDASVYMQRYSAGGTPIGSETRVNQFSVGRQWYPRVAMSDNGEFVVTWESELQDGGGTGVFARPRLGNEFQVNTFTTGDQRFPDIAMDADGDFVIAWQSFGQDGSDYGVYAQRFDGLPVNSGPVISGALAGEAQDARWPFAPGQRLVHRPSYLELNFSAEPSVAGGNSGAHSATNIANYALTRNGVDVSSLLFNAVAGLAQFVGNHRHWIAMGLSALPNGYYVLTAKDRIHDLSGNPLDGDFDGKPGGDFHLPFRVAIPIETGPEFQVNTFTTNRQINAAMAADTQGNYVIAWGGAGHQDGDAFGVFAQRYNAAGVPQGPEFQVNTYTTNVQDRPAVAMDRNGNFVIAWQSFGQDNSGFGIYARRYNAAGVPQGGEFPVNVYTTSDQTRPTVAISAEGNFVIAWQSFEQIGQGNEVYARRYNAAGVALGSEFLVNGSTVGDQDLPKVATNAVGDFVITWTSGPTTIPDPQIDDIYARRFNAAGASLGLEFRVNTHTNDHQFASSIGMDAEGNFVIAWVSNLQDSAPTPSDGIIAQRYDARGRKQGAEFIVNTFTTGNQFAPSVAMSRHGDFVIAWNSLEQDGSGLGIFAQRYSAPGRRQLHEPQGSSEFRVNSFTTGDQSAPAAAMNADGDFIVAWQSLLQDGSQEGIFAQRYAVAFPAVNESTFHYLSVPHRLRFAFNQNVSASLGTDDLLLENLTSGQSIPPGQVSLSYDTSSNVATFSYTGSGGGIHGVLPDGNYRATLLAGGIANSGGTPMAADHVFEFLFLSGDANNDGRVNLADFNILAANFGQSGPGIDFSKGDFNYDGAVNLVDFNILAARFGQVLASPMMSSLPSAKGATFGDSLITDTEDELLA